MADSSLNNRRTAGYSALISLTHLTQQAVRNIWKFMAYGVVTALAVVALGVLVFVVAVRVALPSVQELTSLHEYSPKIPLRIFSVEGELLAEFGQERRQLVTIAQTPAALKNAILAAEDSRFYSHTGVDYVGVLRALMANITSGGKAQGASTITMQVARNFYLSSEKAFSRKVSEILLAFKIEQEFSKDQILELYLNQIYLGQRAYGFAAAAQVYFNKPLKQLTLAESALLAGLPKAPSSFNPVVNPQRALTRRNHILWRMKEERWISDIQYRDAIAEAIKLRDKNDNSYSAFVGEYVRQKLYEVYGDHIYTDGYQVQTTVSTKHQKAAYQAVRRGVIAHALRYGWTGPQTVLQLPPEMAAQNEVIDDALSDYIDAPDLIAGVVLEANSRLARIKTAAWNNPIELSGELWKPFVRYVNTTDKNKKIQRGAVVWLHKNESGVWQLLSEPKAEAALVSMDSKTGAVKALVGGFDFSRNQYNHVTQASRQVGSSIKPFVYSAALEKGYTPASVLEDAPITIAKANNGEDWSPKNYDGKYEGPMRLRTALAKSKNMVSVRLIQAMGPEFAQSHVLRFGFDAKDQLPYLTLALGAGHATPWQMMRAYGVLANGGYLVEPYLIERVVNQHGGVVERHSSAQAGDEGGPNRVIESRNVFLMHSMLQDVTRYGTAAATKSLGRSDLAGKTGTTNDNFDAWFCGYQPSLVAVSWLGFDQPKSLGPNETGSVAALPMWIDYMAQVLPGMPEEHPSMPEGLRTLLIDPKTGVVSDQGQPELMYQEYAQPTESAE